MVLVWYGMVWYHTIEYELYVCQHDLLFEFVLRESTLWCRRRLISTP